METDQRYTVFAGERRVASGPLQNLLPQLKEWVDSHPNELALVFEDGTGKQTDFDLRGTIEDVLSRAHVAPKPGPGRPKLGVVSREVTLLPRHWEWLERAPNGASGAIRRLIDEERKRTPGLQESRMAKDAAARFLSAVAGNLAGYEEASRSLYAGDREGFERNSRGWPEDVRDYAFKLASPAFAPQGNG